MTDDRFELSDLDAARYAGAEERVIAAVMSSIGAQPRLSRPTRWVRGTTGIASLARPLLLAASIVFIAAGIALTRLPGDRLPPTVEAALGLPPMVALWVGGRTPTAGELWLATGGTK